MKKTLFILSAVAAFAAQAEILDRPTGFKIGERMTIRPYVSLYYTWDSNVDSSNQQGSYSSFNISPGLTFTYKADNWNVMGGAYYQYHAYTENAQNLDQSSWGENLAFDWTNSRDGGPGWALVLRENLQKISQDDDMTNDGGRGIGRDRMQFEFAAALQRRFTDRWHADINTSYYYLDYDNSDQQYAPLYGWTRWTVGGQIGFVASKWTDIIIAGNYQGYTQDNCTNLGSYNHYSGKYSGKSDGYTVHVGLGSYATERISYRVTGGYSVFNFSDSDQTLGGFTYTVTGQWRMTDRWNMMLLASSYYQPSETEYGSVQRTDTFSWGIAHSMVRDKLTATLDLTYRHEGREYVEYESSDIIDDIITARLGINYSLNRFLAIFGHCEYQTSFSDGDTLYHNQYDYDRWRLSVGLRLTY